MIDPKSILLASAHYLRRHPEEIIRQLRNAVRLRFGIPVAALQWLANEFESTTHRGPKNVEISPCPPGLRVGATIEQMGTLIRADCIIDVERITIDETQARVELRLKDVSLKLIDKSTQTPLAALIRSGTLDLTRVASLVAHMPSRPAALVEAADDRLVLDLMKLPKWEQDGERRRIVGRIASIATIDTIETDSEHVDIGIKALPRGISGVLG